MGAGRRRPRHPGRAPGCVAARRRPRRDRPGGPGGPAVRYLVELEPERGRGTLLVRRAGRRRARRVAPDPRAGGRPRLPEPRRGRLPRARRARARARRGSRTPPGSRRCPTARRSGPGCSTCATRSSARPSTTCARLPRRTPVSPDASADRRRRLGQPRPRRAGRAPARAGETVGGATFARVPGGKGANQAVACARLGADVTMIAAVGRDSLADEALAGLREAGVALELDESDEPTGVALIQVDRRGETTIVGRPGRERDARCGRARCRRTTRCSASSRCPTRPCSPPGRQCDGSVLPQRRAGAAGRGRRRPDRRQPARARGARRAATASWRSRSAPRARCCSRTGRRSRARRRRRSRPSTAPPPATRSPPACSSRCSKAASEDDALRRACAAGALAASRFGAQPSLPTAAEVDAMLGRATR